jgi:hypothetical protein
MEQSSRAVEGPLDATVVPPAPKRANYVCTTGLANPLNLKAEDQRFAVVDVPLIEERRRLFKLAEENAKKVLKPGDRVRVSKCPGTKRWITFAGWDGHWMVSKSGINDYSPGAVDMVNGEPVDFKAVEQRERHND